MDITTSTMEQKRELVYRKFNRHVIPILFYIFLINYIDRVNISFGKSAIAHDLHFNNGVYTLASSILFIGYAFFEVPSNLAGFKFGIRIWLTRICVTWGLITALTAFMHNSLEFYLLRLALGIAEAGGFPLMVLYLVTWLPKDVRTKISSVWFAALPIALIIGSPLAAWIQSFHFGVVHSWKALFIVEGALAILGGFLVWFLIPEKVEKINFLNAEEKAILAADLEKSKMEVENHHEKIAELWPLFKNKYVWLFGIFAFCELSTVYVFSLWCAPYIKGTFKQYSSTQISWIATIPWICAALAIVFFAHNFDIAKNKAFRIAIPPILSVVGLLTFSWFKGWIGLIDICIVLTFVLPIHMMLYTVVSKFLRGQIGAAGIALINSLGAAGGFVTPYFAGKLIGEGNHFARGFFLDGVVLGIGLPIAYFATKKIASENS